MRKARRPRNVLTRHRCAHSHSCPYPSTPHHAKSPVETPAAADSSRPSSSSSNSSSSSAARALQHRAGGWASERRRSGAPSSTCARLASSALRMPVNGDVRGRVRPSEQRGSTGRRVAARDALIADGWRGTLPSRQAVPQLLSAQVSSQPLCARSGCRRYSRALLTRPASCSTAGCPSRRCGRRACAPLLPGARALQRAAASLRAAAAHCSQRCSPWAAWARAAARPPQMASPRVRVGWGGR